MKEDIKAQWIAALRSSEYTQGRGTLKASLSTGELRHCCLGVLCELTGVPNVPAKFEDTYEFMFGELTVMGMPPVEYLEEVGVSDEDAHRLASMNDGTYREHHSFDEIAGWIEANL